ncbi:MAG: F0F1 ATP synthase subunit delta [Arsenophonus sp.]
MSEITTISRPYAKAAFEFAVENQCVDNWQNMLSFIAEMTYNQEIGKLISSSISPKILAKTFIMICGDKINEYVKNLIYIMSEYKRLSILPEVLKQFIQLRAFLEGAIDISIISSTKLTERQKFKISVKMEKRLFRKVNLNYKIDNSLIAGVIIRIGDLVIDNSVRGYIERLRDVLQS